MHVGSSTRLGKGSEISTGYIFKGKHLLSIYLPFEKKTAWSDIFGYNRDKYFLIQTNHLRM